MGNAAWKSVGDWAGSSDRSNSMIARWSPDGGTTRPFAGRAAVMMPTASPAPSDSTRDTATSIESSSAVRVLPLLLVRTLDASPLSITR